MSASATGGPSFVHVVGQHLDMLVQIVGLDRLHGRVEHVRRGGKRRRRDHQGHTESQQNSGAKNHGGRNRRGGNSGMPSRERNSILAIIVTYPPAAAIGSPVTKTCVAGPMPRNLSQY